MEQEEQELGFWGWALIIFLIPGVPAAMFCSWVVKQVHGEKDGELEVLLFFTMVFAIFAWTAMMGLIMAWVLM